MSAAPPLLIFCSKSRGGMSRARKKWDHGLMDKALFCQSTIGFMALELWSQDFFKRPFLEYVKIKTFLCRFFTLKKLLNDILKKVVKYGTSSDHLIFDKHIILVG
jgi:hypothetical protein